MLTALHLAQLINTFYLTVNIDRGLTCKPHSTTISKIYPDSPLNCTFGSYFDVLSFILFFFLPPCLCNFVMIERARQMFKLSKLLVFQIKVFYWHMFCLFGLMLAHLDRLCFPVFLSFSPVNGLSIIVFVVVGMPLMKVCLGLDNLSRSPYLYL